MFSCEAISPPPLPELQQASKKAEPLDIEHIAGRADLRQAAQAQRRGDLLFREEFFHAEPLRLFHKGRERRPLCRGQIRLSQKIFIRYLDN